MTTAEIIDEIPHKLSPEQVKLIELIAKAAESDPDMLYFLSQAGTGKTFAFEAITKVLWHKYNGKLPIPENHLQKLTPQAREAGL